MTERDERGRYASDHTDADILAAVRARDPAGTSEVADELGVSRQNADKRLRKLADADCVERKKIGAVAIWWLSDEEQSPSDVTPEDGFWTAEPGSSTNSTDAEQADENLTDTLADE